jgi:2-keto-3-deoxy-L-rhamnonate aldolase RhmA
VLVPYINSAAAVRQAAIGFRYPSEGTRSVYFPQQSTNKSAALGYVGHAN